ncbi:MAG TPA: ATP-binding protein [Mycobacteriales bacterium]|nr:ATP-binding protein [Mycobacteriales bacterium]
MRGWRRLGLRARLTLIATAALAVFLAAGSLLLLHGFASSRLHAVDLANRGVAANITALVGAGAIPPTLPVEAGQSAQVMDRSGAVLAVSPGTSRTLPLIAPTDAASIARSGPRSGGVSQTASTGRNRILVETVSRDGTGYFVVVAESLRDEQATLHSLARYVAIAAPVLLLLVGGTLWFLLGHALGAVSSLRRGAENVTHPAGGVRLPLPGSEDEIRALAVTLNAMLDRLGAAAAREQRFVGDVAHELRSPIAATRTQLEVALASSDEATRSELLAGALVDTERLVVIVDDLLTLARMESDSQLSTAAVDLAELAGVASESTYLVRGDRLALARAIDNLRSNAQRHARSAVEVTMGRPDPGTVELYVDDDGPGVPAEDRERIFERFVRLDDARARDDGGSGLGLAIARATAQAHGGSLRVEDSDLGGARFVLAVPAAG